MVYEQITCNFIGKLFNKFTDISINDNSIVFKNKEICVKNIPFKDCCEFATINKGILGTQLVLNVQDISGVKPIITRWLQANNTDRFLNQLNINIAKSIQDRLLSLIKEFQLNVITHYPRDSRMARLIEICSTFYSYYSKQVEQWEVYYSGEYLEWAKTIASFHPLNIKKIREYHENIQLEKRQLFFDKVESNPLTQEQRLGVIRNNDLNMVLAAAGTGKSSVIVAKALDLIDRQLARPDQILILAYNRTAADEVNERLLDKAKNSNMILDSTPRISTFHALGRKILKDAGVPTNISVFAEDDKKLAMWITNWLEEYLSENRVQLIEFINLFPEPTNPFDFQTQAEYERYIRDNEFRTLNNELVKGYQELLIANFLYMNGVDYEYEAPYVSKRRINANIDYRPDFYIKNTNIYIEHFGIDRKGCTRPDIDAQKYNDSIKNKRLLHEECGTELIETFHYEWLEDTLLSELKRKLSLHKIELKPLDTEEILKSLRSAGKISNWSELIKKALQAIRVERLSRDDMLKRFMDANISQPKKYCKLLDLLHNSYKQELEKQNAIDFDDMIIKAISVINNNQFTPTWTYILIDEFQDISAARMELITTIIKKSDQPSLTVVGDDWQSIYRFSGGKLELTTRFEELIGKCTYTILQKTFRYNNSIAHTAGQFIMKNPEQKRKNIETHEKVEESQIFLFDDNPEIKNGLYPKLVEIIKQIRKDDATGTIAVIARYNYLLSEARDVLKSLKKNVNFWSYHKAKGLEADYCVLIGFFQGRSGFPNENRDNAMIEALLPSLDEFPYSEERRLLYVGITRAKKRVYIIASPSAPSDFIIELLAPLYKVNICSNAFQEQYQQIFKCPNCNDGYLRLLNGRYGDFYSCSTGLGCDVGKAKVCEICGSPSVDQDGQRICSNPRCGHSIKLCDKCGRPMVRRISKYGEFWGCSGYGIKEDQCTNTQKI